ncbi:MAG: porin, partial [Pseudomonadales bacterium]|nr:porin [Pseudomonadales bacterium]
VETMFAIRPIENLTIKAFYTHDDDDPKYGEVDLINAWASYVMGGFTFAIEANSHDSDVAEATGGLFMVNYGWEKWGLTGRYHTYDLEYENPDPTKGLVDQEIEAFTLSPSYAVSDNLLLVAEVRVDVDSAGDDDIETNSAALEALITW